MTNTIDTRFFRAGVGTVIYNQAGQVASLNTLSIQLESGSFNKEESTRANTQLTRFGAN